MPYQAVIKLLVAGLFFLSSSAAVADHITGWFKGPNNIVLKVRQQGLNVNGTLTLDGQTAQLSGSSNGGDYVRGTIRAGNDLGTFEMSLQHGSKPVIQMNLYEGNFNRQFQTLTLRKFTPRQANKKKKQPRKTSQTADSKRALPYDKAGEANGKKKKNALPY